MEPWTVENEELIREIVDLELEMFLAVPARERSACQEQPKTFRIMRWMSHSVLPAELLRSILADLERGRDAGRNFMTEKYARMDGLLPPGPFDGRFDEIVEIEAEWMADLSNRFPWTFPGRRKGFRDYMAAELRSFRGETVKLYHWTVCRANAKGRNLAEERYTNLFRRLGYTSIAEYERKERRGTA